MSLKAFQRLGWDTWDTCDRCDFSYGKYNWDICDLYCFMVVRGCIDKAEGFQWGNSALTAESIRYFEEASKQEAKGSLILFVHDSVNVWVGSLSLPTHR